MKTAKTLRNEIIDFALYGNGSLFHSSFGADEIQRSTLENFFGDCWSQIITYREMGIDVDLDATIYWADDMATLLFHDPEENSPDYAEDYDDPYIYYFGSIRFKVEDGHCQSGKEWATEFNAMLRLAVRLLEKEDWKEFFLG